MIKRTLPLIVGNWKTTPQTLSEALVFVKKLDKKISSSKVKLPKKSYLLAVPEVFIAPLSDKAAHGYIGAENVSGVTIGQTTGATIPSQIISAGADFTIIGHSEVRARGEEATVRAQKILASLQSKLTTIVCFGEKTRDNGGKYLAELELDVKQSLSLVPRELFNNLVVAYEPVWAIGGPTPATASECFEVVIALRRALASLSGIDHAKKVHILYGGAVTTETAPEFLSEGGVDGLLLGRASQDVTTFTDIIKLCHSAK
jgi:triosephosphate isomerase